MLSDSFCTCVIWNKSSRSLPFRYDGTGFLFNYGEKQILIVNKILVDHINNDQELLVLNKDTTGDGTITKASVIDRDSFLSDDKTNNNVAITIVEKSIKTTLFTLEENYSPPFPFNNSDVCIIAINNTSPRVSFANFDVSTPYALTEFNGRISFVNEKITVPGLGDLEDQQIVFLDQGTVEFEHQISQGGIVFVKKGGDELPIGFTNALIGGSLRTYNSNSDGFYWSFTHLKNVLKLLNNHPMISYSSTYNHLVEFFIDNINFLRDRVEYFADDLITKKIVELDINSSLDKFISDNMIELRGELFSLRFNLFMIEQNLIDKTWWDFSYKNNPPDDNRKLFLIEQFQKTMIRSFIIGFFSVFEHSLRAMLRRIDTELLNNATDNFYQIRTHYFESLDFDEEDYSKYKTVLKLFALIRNTIHNDGYHYTNREEDYLIEETYNDKVFRFELGEKFEAEYEDYFSLIEDIIEFMWELFESSYIRENFD